MPSLRAMTPTPRRALIATALLVLAAGAPATPAMAGAASPAVFAAQAGGTPVIKPPKAKPKPKPKPFTCTPSKKTKRCVKSQVSTCKTRKGVKTCATKKVTCRRTSGTYKRCITTTGTCRTVRQKRNGKLKKTCRTTGRTSAVSRVTAGVAEGTIARVALRPGAAHAGSPRARQAGPARERPTRLVSATGQPVRPALGSTAHAGATIPLGAGVGALVLILALLVVMGRRRPAARR